MPVFFLLVLSINGYSQIDMTSINKKLEGVSLSLAVSDKETKDSKKIIFPCGKELFVIITVINKSQSTFSIVTTTDKLLQFSPVLVKNSEEFSYPLDIKEKIEKKKKEDESTFWHSGPTIFVISGQEEKLYRLELKEWYGSFEQGIYQLSVKLNLGGGIFIESNTVTFEVKQK
jgi:hypothetical protein